MTQDSWTWDPDTHIAVYKLAGLPQTGLVIQLADFREAQALYTAFCSIFREGIDCGMQYLKNNVLAACAAAPRQ